MNRMRMIMCAIAVMGTAVQGLCQSGAAMLKDNGSSYSITTGQGKEAVIFEIDAKTTGFLQSVQAGDKKLVDGNTQPPLRASVLESGQYDGFANSLTPANGKIVEATYQLDHCKAQQKGDDVDVLTSGSLNWPGGDAIQFEMHTLLRPSGHAQITLQAQAKGTFKNRFLRDFALQLPLALNDRKRVAQGGDRGMRFDTRSKYLYMAHTAFLEAGDFNFWQHFWVDQGSPMDYQLWRSESLATSPLSEFRGRLAPGWTTAYDQQGGVLLSYKDMPAHAPKALYVNTRGSGTGVVYFLAPTHAPLDFQDAARCKQVFDIQHQSDWIFFQGQEIDVKPDQILAKIWNQKLASDPPERADEDLAKINVLDAKLSEGSDAPFVSSGVPFPQGEVTELKQLSVSYNGQNLPLQTKTMAYWPDGSLKWVFLIFPLDPDKNLSVTAASGQGKELPLTITLRNDNKNPTTRTYTVKYGKDVVAGTTTSSLQAETSGSDVTVNTGPLQLRLGKGQQWLQEAKLNWRSLLKPDGRPLSFADFLQIADKKYFPNTTLAQGETDDGALTINKVDLEEAGPLRAMVRLEGMTNSKEPEKVIVRLEFYAGRTYVRMFHTIEFLFDDPRVSYLRKMGISLPLDLEEGNVAATAGAQAGPVQLAMRNSQRPWLPVGLSQDSCMHFSAWTQGGSLFRSVVEQGNRSRGWLDVSDSRSGLAVVLRNAWQEAPSELVATVGEKGGITFNINLWPESGLPMDVRRYSNYPHVSQGESADDDTNWADRIYYRKGAFAPFAGTSKTHEMLLYFHEASVTPAAIDSLAADFQRPALVYCGAKWYADDTKVIPPTILPGDSRYPMEDKNMEVAGKFLVFHQNYWNWFGMWDYGDVGHMFKRGYGTYIPAEKLLALLKESPQERKNTKGPNLGGQKDYWPQHDWAFDNGRWGWSNTEGLSNLYMQLEYLRTGDRDIYFFAQAAAREARDVVARHNRDGHWYGFGTRHGVQHWSDGNHEFRQTINTEFRYDYYLGDDMRSLDWANELTKDFYLKLHVDSDNQADHSAPLYGLLFAWERTNDPKLAQTLKDYVHALCMPDGIDICAPVDIATGQRGTRVRALNGDSFFFQYFGSQHALLEYYELTHDATLRDSMVKFAENGRGDIVDNNDKKQPYAPFLVQAFAARYAPDKEKFQDGLRQRVERSMGVTFQTWPADPSNWTGLTAPVTHYACALFWLNSAGYVLGALDKEPALTSDELKTLKTHSVYTKPPDRGEPAIQIPVERESWQSDLDTPALKAYTTPKRPLEP